MRYKTWFAAACLALSLTSCSLIDRIVYKIDIAQGNFVEQSQVDELRVGMSKAQVEYILGNPLLNNTFSDDRWYYIYRFRAGETGDVEQRNLILDFKQGQLASADSAFPLPDNFYEPFEN